MKNKLILYGLAALAVLTPLLIALPLGDSFYTDWYNHAWEAAYYAEHLRHHFSLPVTFNTHYDIGMPTPLFYGYLFFPIVGLFATVMNPGIAIRLFATLAWSVQFATAYRASREARASQGLALSIATLLTWALYPLTNFYNRSALPEFFSVIFLFCGVLTWFRMLLAADDRARFKLSLKFGLYVCLAMGMHPITGLCGSIFLFVLCLTTSWLGEPRKLARLLVLPAALTALVLLPWLYVTFHFQKDLTISVLSGWWTAYPGIDTLLARFFPYDVRMIGMTPQAVSTPYLDATLNVPLLLLLLVTAVVVGRGVAREDRNKALIPIVLVSLEVFLFFLYLSIDDSLPPLLPHIFQMVQFGYRFVTYCDLAVLSGILMVLCWRREAVRVPTIALVACLAWGFAGVVVKWTHVAPIRNYHGMVDFTKNVTRLPVTFNGYPDYETPDLYKSLDLAPVVLPGNLMPLEGARFGEWDSLQVETRDDAWVQTNVQPFPWTSFWLDGQRVPPTGLRLAMINHPEGATAKSLFQTFHRLVAVKVPPGRHSLEVRIEPDPAWRLGRTLALALLALWALAAFVVLPRRQALPVRDAAAVVQ